jgi:L-rhamnose mutarotase
MNARGGHVIRQGSLLRLKPDSVDEYIRLHTQVPRQVELDEEEAGVIEETIFEHDGQLFVFSVIRDEGTWDRARNSAASREWAERLTPYLEMGPDGLVVAVPLREVYHHRAGSHSGE